MNRTPFCLPRRRLSLDGVRPRYRHRQADQAGGIDEVVLAMNATLEGQTTAHYVTERLENYRLRLSQLSHGMPVDAELDCLDEGTLAQVLRSRQPINTD